MTIVSTLVQTGLTLVAYKLLLSFDQVDQSYPRFITPEKSIAREKALFEKIKNKNTSLETEVADLLRRRPIPDEAFLQSQNITLDMNADPEARKDEFVKQMTPKIVSAAKTESGLPESDRFYRLDQYQNNPLEEVFSAAIFIWSARESQLIEEVRQLRSYLPDKGFRENSLMVLKYLFNCFIPQLLVVVICGSLLSLFGA